MAPARRISAVLACLAWALASALAPSGASAQAPPAGCTPATNVQAIVDDSASMAFRDFHGLRRNGLELFTSLGGNEGKTLGAVEFGSFAETLFAPQPIAAGRGAMVAALRARLRADNGGTDYDAAFTKAFGDNPSAAARIFVTDGPNEGIFRNSHRGGGRIYVVGLRLGPPGLTDPTAARLQQIADETGGLYFPVPDPAGLQPAINAISAAASCLAPPRTLSGRVVARSGQITARAAAVSAWARKLDLVLSWGQPGSSFAISSVQALGRRNRVIADLSGRGRPRKLRARRAAGATFRTIVVNKPRGTRRIRVRVAAGRVFKREPATLQLTQRAR